MNVLYFDHGIDSFAGINKRTFITLPFNARKNKHPHSNHVDDDASLFYATPPSNTLSIINAYFEDMYHLRNSDDSGVHEANNHRSGFRRGANEDDFDNDSSVGEAYGMVRLPDTEYWTPGPSGEDDIIPYYITDNTPLPVTHV